MNDIYNFFVSGGTFKNVDTLRYFFSAVFQGYAALVTLGVMFYLNLQERNRSLLEQFLNQLYLLMDAWYGQRSFHKGSDVLVRARADFKKINPEEPNTNVYKQFENIQNALVKYEAVEAYANILKSIIKLPLKYAAIIIFISLVSLAFVGFNVYIDLILMLNVAIELIISIKFYYSLKPVIDKVINIQLD